MQEIKVKKEKYKRYARLISIEKWRSQVMQAGFQKYNTLDFNYAHFKATEFYK